MFGIFLTVNHPCLLLTYEYPSDPFSKIKECLKKKLAEKTIPYPGFEVGTSSITTTTVCEKCNTAAVTMPKSAKTMLSVILFLFPSLLLSH
jgi:hypothetical protein